MGCCLCCQVIENEYNPKEIKELYDKALEVHNKYREMHKVDALQLDDNLCKKAQERLNQLLKEKNRNKLIIKDYGKNIGENLWIGEKKIFDIKRLEEACESWYNEKIKYKFDSNKYQSGTGHFTQMVWKGTRIVGFGFLQYHENKSYFLALYYPPGNKLFHFKENVINNRIVE